MEKLSAAEEDEFYKAAVPFRLTSGGQVIHSSQPDVSARSISYGGHCTSPFNQYVIAHPRGGGTSRSFFLVGLPPQPEL